MPFNKIRVILVRPSHPGNIGAAARAIKNMGFTTLCLVSPENFPNEVASARASGAEDILESAQVFDTLEDAIADCQYVVTTTARNRSLPWDNFDARTAANHIIKQSESGKVAVVFGPERTGLNNQEIQLSHHLVHICVNDSFSSMNLAAAVMLICYEIRIAALDLAKANIDTGKSMNQDDSECYATSAQVDGFVNHLHQIMEQIGFLKNKPANRLMRRIHRLFNRSRMTEQDVNILRGILAGIESKRK